MKQLTWPTVVLLGLIGGVAVALAALTDWTPSDILVLVSLLAGVGGAGIGGSAVAGRVADRVDQVHEIAATVERRTNGELDQRITDGAKAAADIVLAELRRQGVIR